MNPRENILTALRHEVPERTPATGWFHREVMNALLAHYGTDDFEDVREALGIAGWTELGLGIALPDFEATPARCMQVVDIKGLACSA